MNGQTMLYMFCCYAREDKSYCETLNQYLNGLKRQKSLITWSDQEILAGEEWQTAINTQLQKADIIFCLVSPTFLASEHCYGEIEQALKRQKEGSTYVIPILVRPTYWKNTLLEDLQMLPSNTVAIASWPDAD